MVLAQDITCTVFCGAIVHSYFLIILAYPVAVGGQSGGDKAGSPNTRNGKFVALNYIQVHRKCIYAVVVVTFTTSCISEVSTCTGEATTTAVVLAPAPSGMVIVVVTNVHKM